MTLEELVQRQLELREQFKSANPHADGLFRSPVTATAEEEHPLKRAASELNASESTLPESVEGVPAAEEEQLVAQAR